jgi:general stress protein 26
MASFDKTQMLLYARGHRLAVIGTVGPHGAPTAALVGVAIGDSLEIVLDTVSTSRKHANLLRDPRACVTFSGPGEQTLQYEGVASVVSVGGEADLPWREIYYRAWPEGREHAAWPNIAYWRLAPRWARFSDYDRGPLIVEFNWDEG